jgi:hypothetical protein
MSSSIRNSVYGAGTGAATGYFYGGIPGAAIGCGVGAISGAYADEGVKAFRDVAKEAPTVFRNAAEKVTNVTIQQGTCIAASAAAIGAGVALGYASPGLCQAGKSAGSYCFGAPTASMVLIGGGAGALTYNAASTTISATSKKADDTFHTKRPTLRSQPTETTAKRGWFW